MYVKFKIFPETSTYIEKFLANKTSAGRSQKTIHAYKNFLYNFSAKVNLPIEQITRKVVSNWLAEYRVNKEKKTIVQRLSLLSNFFNYLISIRVISVSPVFRRMKPRKVVNKLPDIISKAELSAITIAAENLGLRDRAILVVLKDSGIRRFELAALDVVDIDLLKGTLYVKKGKNKNKRTIPLSRECLYLLSQYITKENLKTNSPLFLNRYGKRISDKLIDRVCKKVSKLASLKKPIYPHLLRHLYATRLMLKGTGIKTSQARLGHKRYSTMKHYLHLSLEEDIKLVYDKVWR